MRNVMLKSLAGLAVAVLVTAGLALAKTTRSTTIILATDAKLHTGTELKAGTYRLKVEPSGEQADVVFYNERGKEAARVSAKLVPTPEKNTTTQIINERVGEAQMLREIRPGRWTERIVFSTGE